MSSEQEGFNQNSVYSLIENNSSSLDLNIATNISSSDTLTHPIIKTWLYWLGADLVSQWRTLPTEEWSLATIFQEVNPELTCANSLLLDGLTQSKTNSGSIVADLDTEYQNIYQQQLRYFTTGGILKWVIPVAADLANSLTKSLQKSLEQLQSNLEQLQIKVHQKLQIYFYLLKSAGTKTAFASTDSLSEKLQDLSKKYEWQWQDYLYKSNASKHSFENLSAQIFQWWQPDKQRRANSALNALLLTYKFQLQAQLCNAACQLLKELETQTQQHILIIAEVDLWLAQLQSWFMQQYPLDPVPTDFLKQYLSPRINAYQFLEEIEEWTGVTRDQWVNLDTNELSSLKSEILMRLQPVCWKFYIECFQVNKHLNISNSTSLEK